MTKPTAILAVDFDGVLHDYKHPLPGKRLGGPLTGAVDALDDLHDRNYLVIVHTVKAATDQGKQAVEDWLDYYGFEYSQVTAIKPNAQYYIDDRAIKHVTWPDTLAQLGMTDDD